MQPICWRLFSRRNANKRNGCSWLHDDNKKAVPLNCLTLVQELIRNPSFCAMSELGLKSLLNLAFVLESISRGLKSTRSPEIRRMLIGRIECSLFRLINVPSFPQQIVSRSRISFNAWNCGTLREMLWNLRNPGELDHVVEENWQKGLMCVSNNASVDNRGLVLLSKTRQDQDAPSYNASEGSSIEEKERIEAIGTSRIMRVEPR
ncbi:unnamed protein product, partial [Mesorhabditis belari]|uniref:Uncharacterized protein n=1 Tax=Mesorhabditis belari TaxID=2138241 RepID=A0AAF3EBR2_9BILA